MIITILIIYTLVFFLTRVTGNPIDFMTRDSGISDSARQIMEKNMGLDKPLLEQYFSSLINLFTGDYGNSFYYNRPVSELFAERFRVTATLGVTTLLLTALIGIMLGFFSANNHNTWIDRMILILTVVGNTIPNFVLGIILILIFALRLRLLPAGGYGGFKNFIMPLIAMSIAPISSIARITRSSLLSEFSKDHLNTARSKGMREMQVKIRHGLRNSLIPVITILGNQLGGIIGGAVVIETVFAWPGLGQLLITGAKQRDFPVVNYGVLLIAISISIVYFIVDILYMYLDPRIRNLD